MRFLLLLSWPTHSVRGKCERHGYQASTPFNIPPPPSVFGAQERSVYAYLRTHMIVASLLRYSV